MEYYSNFTSGDLERILGTISNESTLLNYYSEIAKDFTEFSKGVHKKPKRTRRCKVEHKAKKTEYTPLIKTPETMNKKLRLLVTTKCHNDCPMCCNKQFDFDTLPIVDRWDYEEIMITGGEPLSSVKKTRYLVRLIESIKVIQQAQGLPISKFYVYTATHHTHLLQKIIESVDGIVYTPHNTAELTILFDITRYWRVYRRSTIRDKSLRLNIFPEIKEKLVSMSMESLIEYMWNIKDIEWVENCPIPEGEDFRKIYMLY